MRFPAPPIADVLSSLRPLVEEVRVALALPPDLETVWVTGPTAPPLNLIRLVYVLPASESNHDAEPLGLATHLLRVAACAVRKFKEHHAEPAIGSPDHSTWQQLLIAVYVAALLHDLGKLLAIDVKAGERYWPAGRYISDFVREAGVSEITVTHRPGRTRGGPSGHEPVSLLFLGQVVPLAALTSLGSQALNDILATMTATLGAEASRPSFRLVKDADAECAKAALLAQRPKAVVDDGEPYVLGSGALAEDFVQGFRQVLADRRVRFNTLDSHLLVSPSHTVLFIQVSGGSSIFHLLFEANAQAARQAQVGGLLRAFYARGDPYAFFPEIASSALPNGLSWCVPAAPVQGGNLPSIRHFCVVTDARGKAKRRGTALILRNQALWGSLDPAERGFFQGRLACFDAADKSVVSVDAEELAFLPVLEDVAAAKPHLVRSATEPVEEGHVLDVDVVAAELVREIGALVPDGGSPEHQRRWESIAGAISDRRLPSIILPSALEACLDRVRHYRHDRRPAVTSAPTTSPPLARPAAMTASTQSLPAGLVSRISAVVHGIVRVTRAEPARLAALAGTTDFHGLALPGGGVFLPWPQCLATALSYKEQVVASEPTVIAAVSAALGVSPPGPVQIAGYPYSERRRSHKGLVIPPGWVGRTDAAEPPDLVLASGALQALGAER